MSEVVTAALIAMGGSVLVAGIGLAGQWAISRRVRKDEKEDERNEVLQVLEKIRKDIDSLNRKIDETAAVQCRIRIQKFADELRIGTPDHSKDSFDQVLEDIRMYDQFCREHQDFRNDITGMSEEIIRESYKKRIEHNDFL